MFFGSLPYSDQLCHQSLFYFFKIVRFLRTFQKKSNFCYVETTTTTTYQTVCNVYYEYIIRRLEETAIHSCNFQLQ